MKTPNIPKTSDLGEIQAAFRAVWAEMRGLAPKDLRGNKLTGAAEAARPNDYVTLSQLDRRLQQLRDALGDVQQEETPFTSAVFEAYPSGFTSAPDYIDFDSAFDFSGNPEDLDLTAFDNTTTPGRVICRRAGLWLVMAKVAGDVNATGADEARVVLEVAQDGSTLVDHSDHLFPGTSPLSVGWYNLFMGGPLVLPEGAAIAVGLRVTGGASLNHASQYTSTRISFVELPT